MGGVVEFTSSDQPISVGSAGDSGNLSDVLQLTNAEVNNTPASGSIIGTANVGGINSDYSFDTTTAAGYKTPVTGGYFTINGARITVLASQNTNDVINAINSSGAGVVASINSATNQITLTAAQTGASGIVLGAAGDTSNFLTAAGLTTASGSTTQIGDQAEVDVLNPNGSTTKYFSNSNTITSAIPGIALTLQSSTNVPFTVTVAQSTTQLVSAVTSFISTYNQAVAEINKATAPPIVEAAGLGSGGQAQSDPGRRALRQLERAVGPVPVDRHRIGVPRDGEQLQLALADRHTARRPVLDLHERQQLDQQGDTGGTAASGSNSNSPIQSTTYEGTDGQLQALDTTSFISAFESNPNGVLNLLNGSNGLTTQLGTYLIGVTGTPTILNAGPVGTIPSVSILQNYENTNTDSITSLQQQITSSLTTRINRPTRFAAQFVASESLISELQSEQSELAAALGFTVSSSNSANSSSG